MHEKKIYFFKNKKNSYKKGAQEVTLHKRVSGALLLNVFSKTSTNLKFQIKPTCDIQVLHSLHGQFPGFHFLISFLKA